MSTDLSHIYRRAAEVISVNGLNKGDYFSWPASGVGIAVGRDECPVCVAGALAVAIFGDPMPDSNEGTFDDAASRLAARVDSRFDGEEPVSCLANWNDKPERTANEVVAELLAAAEAVPS